MVLPRIFFRAPLLSRSNRLRDRAEEAGLTHGSEVIAQVPNVSQPFETHLKACFIGNLRILKVVAEGDGGKIPSQVTISPDFLMPTQPGSFDPIVRIKINGSVQIQPTTEQEQAELALAKA